MKLDILNDEDSDFYEWCKKYKKILNYARLIRLGSTTLHSDIKGNIKAEYKIWSLPLDNIIDKKV